MAEKLDALLDALKDLIRAVLKAASTVELKALLMGGKSVATMVDMKAEL